MIEYKELENAQSLLEEAYNRFEDMPHRWIKKKVCDALFIIHHLTMVNGEEKVEEEKSKDRLTVGCRARILTLKEKPKNIPDNCIDHTWRQDYGGCEVLLTERSLDSFDVMLLGKDVKVLEREKSGIVTNEMAWVPESDMVSIDRDFDTNLDFIDWYKQHEDEFCPACGSWFPDRGRLIDGQDAICPNKECGYSE